MGERRAQQKYYPPEWTPEQGSINAFRGRHPLGARARKLKSEGVLVVRFCMPFDAWCGGCGRHIARGVRFNAEKRTVGAYLSTRIFAFGFKCPSCPQRIEIRTDPQHCDYVAASGAARKSDGEERHEEEEEVAGRLRVAAAAADPMRALEHAKDDKAVGDARAEALAEIAEAQQATADDYAALCRLRRRVRDERKAAAAQRAEGRRLGLGMRLLPSAPSDAREIAVLSAAHVSAHADAAATQRRREIFGESIFGKK